MSVTVSHIHYPDGWEAYCGQWVAIRKDEIIAAAKRPDDLFAVERVGRTDAVWRVPEKGFHLYSSSGQA
jgi:hypothetical protein